MQRQKEIIAQHEMHAMIGHPSIADAPQASTTSFYSGIEMLDHEDSRGASIDTNTEGFIKKLPENDDLHPLSLLQLVRLSGFWFGYHMFWILQTVVLLPMQIVSIVGNDQKGTGLAVVSLTSGVVFGITSLLIGALNDRFGSYFGRRIPFIAIGVVCQCASLFLLWGSEPLWAYTLGYLVANIFAVVASVPYNGLLADVTPKAQNGAVSAATGAANLGGYLVGAGLGICVQSQSELQIYGIITAIFISVSSLTVFGVREPAHHYKQAHNLPIEWVDSYFNLFEWVLAVSAVFGCGFGPFISVEFAMLMDVLPNAADAARDMSLWHMAMVLPQIIATPIAGWLLDITQAYGNSQGMTCFGYKIIYALCIFYFLMGVFMTWRIKGIK
ncbi:hypothetical protein BDV3_003417 [Batrachochytrium dendrobatidis]